MPSRARVDFIRFTIRVRSPTRQSRSRFGRFMGERLFDRQDQPEEWNARSRDGCTGIAPGGDVREHSHTPNQEILFCFEGKGTVLVDGVPHPFVPGTTVYAGPGVRHKIINDGPGELKMTWTYLPPELPASRQRIEQIARGSGPRNLVPRRESKGTPIISTGVFSWPR